MHLINLNMTRPAPPLYIYLTCFISPRPRTASANFLPVITGGTLLHYFAISIYIYICVCVFTRYTYRSHLIVEIVLPRCRLMCTRPNIDLYPYCVIELLAIGGLSFHSLSHSPCLRSALMRMIIACMPALSLTADILSGNTDIDSAYTVYPLRPYSVI